MFRTNRLDSGASLEESKASDGFMDLYWEGVCIIEMKAPGETDRLERHRKQALDYWAASADLASHREQPLGSSLVATAPATQAIAALGGISFGRVSLIDETSRALVDTSPWRHTESD